jgi:predicted ester cyclase
LDESNQSGKQEENMSSDENKAIARRYFEEAWNQGRVEVLDEIYAPDGSVPETESLESVKGNIAFWQKHGPGYQFTILHLLAEEDIVMVRWQVDVTYFVPAEPPPDEPFLPLGKPASWQGVETMRIVGGKIVATYYANPWSDMLIKMGMIPLEQVKQQKAAVVKFIDGLNRQDAALLAEVSTPEIAKEWTEAMSWMYTTMKDHHMELTEIIADGNGVAVKMATSGYHTGELFGLPATGKWWTNRVFVLIHFMDGKICEVDSLPDVENHLKQLGGVIRPAVE